MADTRASTIVLLHPTPYESNQSSGTIQCWTVGSSSTSFLPPTPTKDMHDMAAEPAAPLMADTKKTCDISNLMSPPEPIPLDSFRPEMMVSAERSAPAPVDKRPGPDPPLSPPVSPPSKTTNLKAVSPVPPVPANISDPILYPGAENAISPPSGPLFPMAQSLETINAKELVDQHIASRPASLFRGATPPRREDYELALFFKSNCLKNYVENPKAYLRKERELLRADRKNVMARPYARLPPILPASRPTAPKPYLAKTTTGRVQKPKSPKIKPQNPRPIRATPTTARHTIRVSATPEPRVRTVAPNREDKDFSSLEDYCPPLNSLPNKPNSLKVDWKGNALDLSKDPHAGLLHPDELLLAAGLRLDCATYLTSKRRIFQRRLECAKIGKEFRKTDAQQACKIDVNKASKLWTAYDRVGWLDIKWMDKFFTR